MKAEILDHAYRWAAIKHAAMTTVGKEGGRYPSPSLRRSILLAEHSPIRRLRVAWPFSATERWDRMGHKNVVLWYREKTGRRRPVFYYAPAQETLARWDGGYKWQAIRDQLTVRSGGKCVKDL